jgi:hypothetical protein
LTAQQAATVESNRRATFAAIKALQWLATEMCLFVGTKQMMASSCLHTNFWPDNDPDARTYLDSIEKIRSGIGARKPEVNVLSPRNIRRLLNIMYTMVVQQSVEAMKIQEVCSLIVDGT